MASRATLAPFWTRAVIGAAALVLAWRTVRALAPAPGQFDPAIAPIALLLAPIVADLDRARPRFLLALGGVAIGAAFVFLAYLIAEAEFLGHARSFVVLTPFLLPAAIGAARARSEGISWITGAVAYLLTMIFLVFSGGITAGIVVTAADVTGSHLPDECVVAYLGAMLVALFAEGDREMRVLARR